MSPTPTPAPNCQAMSVSEEAGIVSHGQIEITVADQVRVLSLGEGYLFDSRLPHRFRNVGTETCRIISACTPLTF